jgi:glycosyltransferase involved in cell wall biosynthesis
MMTRQMRTACVAVARDEQAAVAEWIAYQFAIGFDTVIVYDNGSEDRTAEIALAFTAEQDVRLVDWPLAAREYQLEAYKDAVRQFGAEFEWMAFFDLDEFLVLPAPQTLSSLLHGQSPEVSGIAVPWAIFGSSGLKEPAEGLVIETYRLRSAPEFDPNRLIKSIVRPARVTDVRSCHVFQVEGHYRSLSGQRHRPDRNRLEALPDYSGGKLHHYYTKSSADWRWKVGVRGYRDVERELSEFDAYDRNEVLDASATQFAPDVRRVLDALGLGSAGAPSQG